MKIILTHEESESIFLDALCNGFYYVSGYGLELDFNEDDYQKAKKEGDCYEDVLMGILRDGGSITLNDIEGDGAYTKSITLQDVHKRVADTPICHLMDAINEHGDAVTSDVILQSVFFGEIVFG